MTATFSALDAIPEPMGSTLRQFATLLQNLTGTTAESLTLFGAIARGTFDATRHTARSVLVVSQVDLGMLKRLAEHGAKLGKQHLAAPLIMTPSYIDASRDTFPLELIEIQQNRIVAFGKDFFEDLEFNAADVRLQCERELKVILIHMRQGLLAAAGREKVLAQLVTSGAENLLRTLRGMLWLKERREAQPASSVLDEVENLAKRKLPGIRGALDSKVAHEWDSFTALYRDTEALGELVNGW